MLPTKGHQFYSIPPGNPISVFIPFSLFVERLIRAALNKRGSAPVELISFFGRICCDSWNSIWPLLLRSRRQRMEMSRFECEIKRRSLPKINVHACVRWLWRQSTYWKSGGGGGGKIALTALKFARTPSVSSTWLRQWRRTSSFSCVCAAGANSISPLVRSLALLQLQREQLVCAPQKSSSLTIRNKSAAASHGAHHFFPIHQLLQKCTNTLEIVNWKYHAAAATNKFWSRCNAEWFRAVQLGRLIHQTNYYSFQRAPLPLMKSPRP